MRALFADVSRDRIGLIAAGIAFYGMLSLFPGLAAVMALGGLLTKPAILIDQMQQVGSVLPPEAAKLIIDQAVQIAGSEKGGLGLAAIVGFGLSIYSASNAVGSLIVGIHVAASQRETRGFFANYMFVLGMTIVTIALALLALFSTVVVPAVLAALNVSGWIAALLELIRWPIMVLITVLGLGLFYRLSIPHRSPPRWVTPGAIVGAALWLMGSVAFSIYVQNFANYNKTFGTLGGVVSLLIWLWLSAYVALLGEAVNSLIDSRKKAKTAA